MDPFCLHIPQYFCGYFSLSHDVNDVDFAIMLSAQLGGQFNASKRFFGAIYGNKNSTDHLILQVWGAGHGPSRTSCAAPDSFTRWKPVGAEATTWGPVKAIETIGPLYRMHRLDSKKKDVPMFRLTLDKCFPYISSP